MAYNYIQLSTQVECETEEQATWLAEELGFRPSCGVEIQKDNKTVWLYGDSDQSVDLQRMVEVLCEFQTHFKLKTPVSFSWANTCSKLRLDEFSGGAVVVKDGKSYWVDAQCWAQKKLKELEAE
jgi:hypothetical protein